MWLFHCLFSPWIFLFTVLDSNLDLNFVYFRVLFTFLPLLHFIQSFFFSFCFDFYPTWFKFHFQMNKSKTQYQRSNDVIQLQPKQAPLNNVMHRIQLNRIAHIYCDAVLLRFTHKKFSKYQISVFFCLLIEVSQIHIVE